MNSRLFTRKSVVSAVVFAFCAALALYAGLTHAQEPSVGFVVSFSPGEIGPGSASTMSFAITNGTNSPLTDLQFSNVLPAGLTIASPAGAVSGCGGTVSAPDGGSSISFNGGSLVGGGSCAISVNVIGAPPIEGGTVTYTNPPVALKQSGDTIATSAPANLVVFTNRPGFSKSFSPAIVPFGGRTKLTFFIDNTANSGAAFDLAFTDNLPLGLVVASPANPSSTCFGGIVTAVPGSGVISFGLDFIGGPSVPALESCSVSVDVVGNVVGTAVNTSGDLTSAASLFGVARSSGKATAALVGTNAPIVLQKTFVNDPVPPGGTVDLKFTITNVSREDATGISFTDDLDAALSGLVATGLETPISTCGGTLSGTSVIAFSGGTLFGNQGLEDPQFPSSCSFTVTLQVPSGTPSGFYTNTTSPITASTGTGSSASDVLFVQPAPLLSMTFAEESAAAGGTVTLDYTITNSSPSAAASDITFENNFFAGFPTAVLSSIPAEGFCGPGSIATFTPLGGFVPAQLLVSGGNLAPGASCTFSITLNVSADAPTGAVTNTTGPISGTVEGVIYTGQPASDTIEIFGGPRLIKEFIDDPVNPGGLVTLNFTLTHSENATADATGINFTDDLNAVIPGMTAVGLPLSDVCGAGSMVSGTSSVSFTGGTLMPGTSCTFSVQVQVPAGAPFGSHTNTTSSVGATVGGLPTLSPPATANLLVGLLKLTKSFTNDPVAPGETVNLQFTIDNTQGSADATGLSFTDDLAVVLSGLVATGLPVSGCGGGMLSGAAGNSFLSFSGGSVAAGQSCSFSVTLQVPAGALSNTYQNTTSGLVATIDGNTITFPNASDGLVVLDTPLVLAKSFAGNTVPAGGTVGVTFLVVNIHQTSSITNISFTDDLNAALSGLTATSVSSNTCGATVGIPAGQINVSGGSVGPNSSCEITVALQVPAGAQPGTTVINTTSAISGTLGAVPIFGDPASDTILITLPGSLSSPNVTIEQGVGQPDPTSTSPIVFDVVFSAEMVDFDSGNDVTLSGGAVTPGQTTATVIPLAPFDGTRFRVEVSGLTNIGTVVATIAAGAAVDRFGNPNNASTSVDNVVTFIPAFVNQTIFGNVSLSINQNTTITGNVASQQNMSLNSNVKVLNGKVTAVQGSVTFNSGVKISGNVDAGGAVTVGSSSSSNMATAGNITSGANVTIGAFASVGDLKAAGNITVHPSSTTGTRTPNAMVDPLPNILLPDLNFSAGGPNVILPANGSLTLGPGSYGALILGSSATLTLSGGSYAFNSIVAGSSSQIAWNAPTTINVVGNVSLGSNSQMSGVATNLLIQSRGTSVALGSGGTYRGTVLAPNASISMGGASFTGGLFGRSVSVNSNSTITGDVALNLLIAAGTQWTPKVLGLRDESFNNSTFVRQQYVDFLHRDADSSGLAFWTGQLDECENATLPDQFSSVENCREVRRINVSAAFFLSIEFQNSAYFLYRLNQAAFNSGPTLQFGSFLTDKQEIQRGVVVGQGNWQQQIQANKVAFANAFVARPEFITAYPVNMTAASFVDALNANTKDPSNPAGGSLTQEERDNLVAQLTNGTMTRAQVLRSIAESSVFQQREFNRAFVLMQYFGYLRRNPNAPPDADFSGYNFWLNKLNQFGGNFVEAEMVKAFINSGEYLNRFRPQTR